MVYPPRTTSLVLVKFRDPIENYISISFSVRIFFWIGRIREGLGSALNF